MNILAKRLQKSVEISEAKIELLADTARATHYRIGDVTVSLHKQGGKWFCHTCKGPERSDKCFHIKQVRKEWQRNAPTPRS